MTRRSFISVPAAAFVAVNLGGSESEQEESLLVRVYDDTGKQLAVSRVSPEQWDIAHGVATTLTPVVFGPFDASGLVSSFAIHVPHVAALIGDEFIRGSIGPVAVGEGDTLRLDLEVRA